MDVIKTALLYSKTIIPVLNMSFKKCIRSMLKYFWKWLGTPCPPYHHSN